jgi:hypothetical protein
MEVVYPRCSGLDVHKRFVVACLSIIQDGERHKELRQVSTMTSDILALKEWLLAVVRLRWKQRVCIGSPFSTYLKTLSKSYWSMPNT